MSSKEDGGSVVTCRLHLDLDGWAEHPGESLCREFRWATSWFVSDRHYCLVNSYGYLIMGWCM